MDSHCLLTHFHSLFLCYTSTLLTIFLILISISFLILDSLISSFHTHSLYIPLIHSTMQPLPEPYTQTLSMLWKIDLLWLLVKFKLPMDGTVLNMRDHLRVYLNSHIETFYRNPRYRLLYPQHRRVAQPVRQQLQHNKCRRHEQQTRAGGGLS